MSRTLHFSVPGLPQQQGSKRHIGNGVMVETNKALAPWRADAIAVIQQAMGDDWEQLDGPIQVDVEFWYPRPKSHYRTGRNAHLLKDSAPSYKASTPDVDKLLRALDDAITQAGAWHDDAQAARTIAAKLYADDGIPCTSVILTEILTGMRPDR